MARQPTNLKAQLITMNENGDKKYKRSFSKIRHDISDQELTSLANGIKSVLNKEYLNSMNLTANSSLDIEG